LESIFDFNFQAGDGRMKMGFGLSTDFKIIQDHRGEIQIESEVGTGTEVTVSLPVVG
jgi:signal transduction histidine kinase